MQALFALASVALARPADEAAAVAPLVYGALPYGALAAPGYVKETNTNTNKDMKTKTNTTNA